MLSVFPVRIHFECRLRLRNSLTIDFSSTFFSVFISFSGLPNIFYVFHEFLSFWQYMPFKSFSFSKSVVVPRYCIAIFVMVLCPGRHQCHSWTEPWREKKRSVNAFTLMPRIGNIDVPVSSAMFSQATQATKKKKKKCVEIWKHFMNWVRHSY